MGTAGAIIAILLISSVVWIKGDTERVSLKSMVKSDKIVRDNISRELAQSKEQVAELEGEIARLETVVAQGESEKKRLEGLLANAVRQKEELASLTDNRQLEIERAERAEYQLKTMRKIAELEAEIKAANSERERLEREMRRRVEDDAAKKFAETEAQLRAMNRKQEEKLQQEEGARKELELALDNYKKTLGQVEARLRDDALLLKNEDLSFKLKDARIKLEKAHAGGAITDGLFKDLDRNIADAEAMIAESKDRRIATEALLSKQIQALTKGASGEFDPGFGSVEAQVALEKLQKEFVVQSKSDFKQRLSSLEHRLVSLESDKKAIEERWSEAMAAITKMEETARSIEANMQAQELPVGAPDKLKAEMESLKAARQDVKLAMESVKSAIQSSMNTETKRMMQETSQVSEALNRLYVDSKIGGLEKAYLSEGRVDFARPASELNKEKEAGPEGAEISSLDRKFKELNYLLGSITTGAAGEGRPAEDAKPVDIMMSKLLTNCEDQLKELMSGKKQYGTYVVKDGDTLWNIAAKKEVYADPFLWPALFKHNVFIVNPDIIEPNTTLFIRKDMTEQEKSEVRAEARRRAPKGQVSR